MTILKNLKPETLALIVALGLVFGTFPVYGCPTLLCLAAALALRLNAPALQAVNYMASPLQLALLVPFHRVGERLLPAQTAPAGLVSAFAAASTRAVAGWFCVGIPLGILLYFLLRLALGRGSMKFAS
jgi:uncharacterized protein (DUF2062 family)